VLRFTGFELDPQRAELRGPDGETIRLRPKSFDLLQLFAANAGRVLSKQELIEAIWPKVHVGEDSLFQCIREIRTALGDDRRQLIKLVSGRGYLFEAEVSREPAGFAAEAGAALVTGAAGGNSDIRAAREAMADPTKKRLQFGLRGPAALATVAGIGAVVGLAAAAPIFAPDFIFARMPPTIAVTPIIGASNDPQLAQMAASVTDRLTDGLARIDNIRVVASRPQAASGSPEVVAAHPAQADFVVSGELQKDVQAWTMQARLTSSATGEVRWTSSVSVGFEDTDTLLQQSRLAAGLGHPLAVRINALLNSGARPSAIDSRLPEGKVKVVIEQAMAFINQTTPERFRAAQAMLEKALAADPDNLDLEAALAAHLLRGIQSAWYNPADVDATERSAQSMLEHALRRKPSYLPVLEGYCRFLTATNRFAESLIRCASILTFDPWDGLALFNLGATQVQLGRFEDALATFKQADQYDTPQVSRWTWLLGAGWTHLLMGHNEEALSWLQRSIAITPGTGRTHALLAAAYQLSGRADQAKAAMAKTMELRPGSTAANILPPTRNANPAFLAANQRILRAEVEAGLPEW
jgi:DNA-binding winged helix-turn-helix (wHTH) protein/Tfp pilus assembly protein PilF/TolB-like protein